MSDSKQYVLKKAPISKNPLPENFGTELNEAQREVVFFNDGPLLVIAGAGSGKTKTLVHRVARLVHEGVRPESILLLTFTRKSSQEMLKRASEILDNRCQSVTGGTFHAFTNTLLREFGGHIGYNPNFTILDRGDAEDIISTARQAYKSQILDKRFPKKGTIATIISKATNTGKPIRQILMEDYPQFMEYDYLITRIEEDYQQQKKLMQAMDYDDLLVQTCTLLQSCENVRKTISNRYQFMMVDEYQDTNTLQNNILMELVNPQHNIMVVGDDAQSIYSFRGANFKNIMNFPTLFPDATHITLEENYRSTQPILDLTNAVIAQAKERFTKNLFSRKETGEKPVFVDTDSDHMQSKFVSQKVLELREDGIPLKNMAVLIRSGWHSNDLEVELKAKEIPFAKIGGFKFVETSHVKDLISYIRVVYNPAETVSWRRILQLMEGLGPKSASELSEAFSTQFKHNQPLSCEHIKKKKFYAAVYKLLSFVNASIQAKYPPKKVLEKAATLYEPLFEKKYDDFNKRKSDLTSIQSIADRFMSLEDFLTEMSLEPPDGTQSSAQAKSQDEERMTISTIHSSKGLEWDVVFLISAVDGYLPSFQSLGDKAQVEEERRLLYVALTRAKQKLFIIKPNLEASSGQFYRYTGIQFSQVSRFLAANGILEDMAERWHLVEEEHPPLEMFPSNNDALSETPDDLPPRSNKKYFF